MTADYLTGDIASIVVPVGKVVVHNHVTPARIIGTRGFRAWLAEPDESIEPCRCGWAPALGVHYRIARAIDGGAR